jgi:methionyl-tRNA synthetase
MPDKPRNKYLITSALPYINGVKHLGNLVGSLLPADVYARYLRARGHEVLAICGTDEHGTPAEIAALEAGQPVDEYCREQYEIQKNLGDRWCLSFDHFGRSSSAQNEELTLRFYHDLDAHDLLVDRTTTQVYSKTDGRFLPDRYVIGTCPHCGFERARGDQCENCTRVLDPSQLINPRSAISGATDIEPVETLHLYLRLDRLSDRLREWITTREQWPLLTTSIGLKWLNEGLRERAITRDLEWGFRVPRKGYEKKVFYVWFDAPIEYIGATKEWADAKNGREWEPWWLNADDVTYVQFMGKDNVPFHTIMWPGMVMGTGEPWKQADFIKSYSWLTYEGGKFSTSQGRGIFMDTALELLPADYWRWYLMANAPESDDSDFTWEAFALDVNKALGGTLGNFVNRTLKLTEQTFGSATVPAGGAPGDIEEALVKDLSKRIETFIAACDAIEFRKAAAELYLIWTAGNQYLTQREPWALAKTDTEMTAMVLRTAINLIRVFALLASPFIPNSAGRVFDALQLSDAEKAWPDGFDAATVESQLQVLEPGRKVEIPEVLFPKVQDEDVAAWKERFSGQVAVD